MIKSVEVFDPAMCCSTGVCGPAVDPALARFAGDVEWLGRHGLKVERFNLGQEPGAFAGRAVVREALAAKGQSCLPLTLVDGQIVREGVYPTRDELVVLARVPVSVLSYSPAPVAEASPTGGGCCQTGSC